MFKAFVAAHVTAQAFEAVGEATGAHFKNGVFVGGGHQPLTPDQFFGSGRHLANIAGHAAVGCAAALAQGGRCGPQALAAGAGSLAAPQLVGLDSYQRVVASVVLGGTSSAIGGGKFSNGAITAAYGYLYNFINFLAGGGFSAVFGGGVEGSAGVAFNPGFGDSKTDVFQLASVGAGAGLNVSADVFVGFVLGDNDAVKGAAVNFNYAAGPFSLTVFVDPSTEKWVGGTFGVGPPGTGGSMTYSYTTTGGSLRELFSNWFAPAKSERLPQQR